MERFELQRPGRRREANGAIQSDTWYSPEAKAIVKVETTKDVLAGVSHYAYELTAFKVQ